MSRIQLKITRHAKRLENVTHNNGGDQFNGNRPESTKVMIKADKRLKIAITNIIHMYKDAKNSINMRKREDRIRLKRNF